MTTQPNTQPEELLPSVPKQFRVKIANREAFNNKPITFTNLPADHDRLYSGSGRLSLGGESNGCTTATIFITTWENYSGSHRVFNLGQLHVDQIKCLDDHLELHF